MEKIQAKAWEDTRRIVFSSVAVGIGASLLFFIQSPRIVVFDWPCREEQFAYEAAFAKWQEADGTWYDARAERSAPH